MNKIKIVYSLLAILFGVFMFVYGEFDDSPGGQLIGLVLAIIGIVGIIKSWKKNSESMKKFIICSVLVFAIFAVFFVRIYIAETGFTTPEDINELNESKHYCWGLDISLGRSESIADAPRHSLCIGLLK